VGDKNSTVWVERKKPWYSFSWQIAAQEGAPVELGLLKAIRCSDDILSDGGGHYVILHGRAINDENSARM